MWLDTRALVSYESHAVIMENLATVIRAVDHILQCCRGLSALTRFLIILDDVASYESGGELREPCRNNVKPSNCHSSS